MTQDALLKTLNELTTLIEAENLALEACRPHDAIAMLPVKKLVAARLAEMRLDASDADETLRQSLIKVRELSGKNATLLQLAIKAQENVIRLLTIPQEPNEQSCYGRSGSYATVQRLAPVVISAET
ncbi:hypothetical protein [Brytella acorum]|uniref:Flagellar protein FlgN n=1 Tax=Brytella acorum TaxID=2959299 RepID=A0AA35UW51_9PROT|nr:hypothetical protein [Brytella acorum]MDF3624065.1 hypothetical protein [Brytella acorum]CAI9120594.1 hypothetical protein LMG32879_001427 [Brytella acorum]